ncbi:hypothetical protein PQC13_gp269 [Synechococcus phage S-SRM01]|uniref:Uncharacterized protein n=1 Tax=Synechococcus phage S-SRM01 TaxID=2781608 RepID=A0A879R219_9CAUD|nr:hypothetical protein PQC13_gp269 [Synechococcus phage S-SRM01]QPX48234.1 hypothetical protein [Synechococcus phage S-SRM01]
MSRITGFDAANLIEAYNAVYAPQEEIELTEEQFAEEVQHWVDVVLDEGHDLSSITWDDIYLMAEDAVGRTGRSWGQQFGQALRGAAGGALNSARNVVRGAADVAGASAQGLIGQKTTSTNPLARMANTSSRIVTAPARGYGRFVQGSAEGILGKSGSPTAPSSTTFQNTGGYGRYQSPATQQYGNQSRFAGARDAAVARARQIKGSPVVGPRLVGPGSSSTPARPAVRPAATTTASTRPVATALAAPAAPRPTPTAAVPNAPAAPRPSLAQQRAELEQMRKRSQQRIMAQGGTPATPLVQSFDPFDIVMGYLIDEGYAENEEAATVIMANMSEGWREEILEGRVASETMGSGERRRERNDRYREENPTLPSGNPIGSNAQLMRQMAHAKKRGVKKKKD